MLVSGYSGTFIGGTYLDPYPCPYPALSGPFREEETYYGS